VFQEHPVATRTRPSWARASSNARPSRGIIHLRTSDYSTRVGKPAEAVRLLPRGRCAALNLVDRCPRYRKTKPTSGGTPISFRAWAVSASGLNTSVSTPQ